MAKERSASVGGHTVERLVAQQIVSDPQSRIDSLCCGVFTQSTITGLLQRRRDGLCLNFPRSLVREVITADTDAEMTGVVIQAILPSGPDRTTRPISIFITLLIILTRTFEKGLLKPFLI